MSIIYRITYPNGKIWCAKHRSHSLRSRIQAARTQADVEAQQIKAETIAEREQTEGLSDKLCRWSGCNNRALAGRALCASHILEGDWERLLSGPYMNLRPVLDG
jgi:hypothetical protein